MNELENVESAIQGSGNITKVEFDADQIADPRKDELIEGGISKSRSTGATGLSEASPKDGVVLFEKEQEASVFEIGGFEATYKHKDNDGVVSGKVRRYFRTLDEVKRAFVDGKYICSDIKMDITLGVPEVYVNDILRHVYKDGKLVRV